MSRNDDLLRRAKDLLESTDPADLQSKARLHAALSDTQEGEQNSPVVRFGEEPDERMTAYAHAERALEEALKVSVSPEAFELFRMIEKLSEEHWWTQIAWFEDRLHELLPQHCRIIHQVFGADNPDDPALDVPGHPNKVALIASRQA